MFLPQPCHAKRGGNVQNVLYLAYERKLDLIFLNSKFTERPGYLLVFAFLVQEGTNAIRYTSSYVMKDYLTELNKAIKYSTMTVYSLC